MNITQAIDAFFSSQAGQLSMWVLLLPVIDFGLGIAAAVRDGTFRLDAIAAFLRKHIAGRVIPLWVLLFLGYVASDIVLPVIGWPALTSVGVAAAGVYLAETIGSILASWGPGASVQPRDATQPIPKD